MPTQTQTRTRTATPVTTMPTAPAPVATNTNTNTAAPQAEFSLGFREHLKLAAVDLNVDISPTTTHKQALRTVKQVCEAMHEHDADGISLNLMLGRVMVVVQDHRLYEPDFTSFEQFLLATCDEHRISRTSVRDAMLIARRLPDLTAQEASDTPIANLTMVARAAKDARPRAVNALLREAANTPVADFRKSVMERGLVVQKAAGASAGAGATGTTEPEGDGNGDSTNTLSLSMDEDTAQMWEDLVGRKEPGAVFAELVAAAWDAQFQQASNRPHQHAVTKRKATAKAAPMPQRQQARQRRR